MTTPKFFAFISRRAIQVLGHWLAFMLPLVVVFAGAFFLFRESVVRVILSTQHPELVYLILCALLVGVVMTTMTLARYTKEGNLIHQWMNGNRNQTGVNFQRKVAASYLEPLYAVLGEKRSLPEFLYQQMTEREVSAIQIRLQERLALPQFLAGAMVGLGLVGTFVGLLGTLEDLGKIFSVAPSSPGGAAVSPVELFSGMMGRLQAPMRGMGTAFVASLFGLLGSLMLGLQILLASKVGHSLIEQIHALVRQNRESERTEDRASTAVNSSQIQINLGHAVKPILDVVQITQSMQIEQLKNSQLLSEELRKLQLNHVSDYQKLHREVLAMVNATQTLMVAVGQNVSADERYRASVPRTTYWQDAWGKVQVYLQRSNTDASLAQLTEASKAQVHVMAEVAKTLSNIEHRLRVSQVTQDLERH